jgi:hypothetical protein
VQIETGPMARSVGNAGRHDLCAVLLNPSFSGTHSVSHANLRVVAEVLGLDRVLVVNLVGLQTRNSRDLAELATTSDAWHAARPEIEAATRQSNHLLFGWGDSRLRGIANTWKQEQIEWTVARAIEHGHEHVLMMDEKARHPSRWRQYVGPQRGLFTGSSIEHRFVQALRLHRTDSILGSRRPDEVPTHPVTLDTVEISRFARVRTSA